MNRILFLAILLLATAAGKVCAWQHSIRSPQIRTLRVVKNGDASLFPALDLRGDDRVEISFDDMTHVYHRYSYRLIHCDANWNPSEGVFESDYMDGSNDDLLIENYSQSLNTTVLYTHYSFSLPNAQSRFRISGNYKVEIYQDEDEEPVATAFLCVVDAQFGITAKVLTNTDVDWNKNHQQIEWTLRYGNVRVLNPEKEIRTVVMQNRRWDNRVADARPTFITAGGLEWRNSRPLIFKAGNEYRKFEVLNVHLSTLGVDRMAWYEPYYHAILVPGAQQRNYIFQEDQNGRAYIRNEDNENNDTESDYVIVHYTLRMPQRHDGDFYVCGDWTGYAFSGQYKMTYDPMERAYVADVLQKQGYYNYQYLFVEKNSPGKGLTEPAEGDFYQTENEYTLLVYYRSQTGRYDRLAGFRDFTFSPGR